jgi:anaerobic magnesium-protoporphyrin IX monomethyl ester cyclase
MRKIIFIEPKTPNIHIFSQYPLPRLGLFILAAILKEKGWDAEVIIEETHTIDFEKIKKVDMVGISTITPTAVRAYAIADKIRSFGIPVIFGGPHVTFLPEEALAHADYVFRGEAEEALISFIDTWENGKVFSNVPNLSYQIDGQTYHNQIKPLTRSLDEIPFPDFSLSQYVGRSIAGLTTIPVQTSRGCPFHCSFCSVTGMFGKAYRFRSAENVIEELRRYDPKKKSIFFYDDNFTANRKRAKELLQSMIDEKLGFIWSTQVRVDIANDLELVRLMKKAGCHTVYIGMESVNPSSLKSMKKQQTVEQMAHAMKILRQEHIRVHGMFVYGFDDDNWQTVKETVKFAIKTKCSSTQFMILTPLPGSEFYDQMIRENRIRFHDWTLYDAQHAVFEPKQISLHDLQRAQIFSHSKFYSLLQVMSHALSFRWAEFGIALYARQINRRWLKQNKSFLKTMDSFRTRKKSKLMNKYGRRVRPENEMVEKDSLVLESVQ